MKKFYLFAQNGHEEFDSRKCIECDGFAEAEAKAKELIKEMAPDGQTVYWDGVYVSCLEDPWDYELSHYAYGLSSDGECCWWWLSMGEYSLLSARLLDDDELEELEEWRNEKELHVDDLTDDELRKLFHEISFGSIYSYDYRNSFYINEREVSDVADDYLNYLAYDEGEGTQTYDDALGCLDEESWIAYIRNY